MMMTDLALRNAQLDLDRRKLELEEKKVTFEVRKFEAEQSQGIWIRFATQLSVAVPVVTLLIGAFLSRHETLTKAKRDFIHRQLTEFYYPLKFSLQRDTATSPLAFPNCDPSNKAQRPAPKKLCDLEQKDPQISHGIQTEVLIPNQQEAIAIMNKHLELVRNSQEGSAAVSDLLQAISQYQTHTVLYKTLLEANTSITPYDIDPQKYQYPYQLENDVDHRIEDLNAQLRSLGEK